MPNEQKTPTTKPSNAEKSKPLPDPYPDMDDETAFACLLFGEGAVEAITGPIIRREPEPTPE